MMGNNALASTVMKPSVSQQKFIKKLLPNIHKVNATILEKRARLLALHQQYLTHQPFSVTDQQWLAQLTKDYKLMRFDINRDHDWTTLARRVDVIPPGLALAQAANETAWGHSRFAKEGNNYFGQRCHTPGCGIIPKERSMGTSYEVKKFTSPLESIQSYVHNLNTNEAYLQLRLIREEMRDKNEVLTAIDLTKGLTFYSEQGDQYTNMIQNIINDYQLAQHEIDQPSS